MLELLLISPYERSAEDVDPSTVAAAGEADLAALYGAAGAGAGAGASGRSSGPSSAAVLTEDVALKRFESGERPLLNAVKFFFVRLTVFTLFYPYLRYFDM